MNRDLTLHKSPLQPDRSVPLWWSDLFRQSASASLFLSPEWMQSWIDIYGSDFRGVWVRLEAGGRTVGGCLLLKRTVWWRLIPQPSLYMNVAAETNLLSPWSEYNQALYLEGYDTAVAEALIPALAKMNWTRLELWGYAANSFSERLLAGLPSASVQTREERAPYVDLELIRGNEYEATMSSRTRSQIRKCRRLYEDLHGKISIEFARDCDEALEFLDELASLHNAIWRARGEDPSFEVREFMEFHRQVVRRMWPGQSVDLLRVRAQGYVIGYLFNFKLGGKIYCYQSGFVRESDSRLKPGLLTHATAIAEYGRLGFREYDLLGGDSRYKRSLTKSYRTQTWSTCYRDSLYGRALWKARQLKARFRPNGSAANTSEDDASETGGVSAESTAES